MTGHGLAPVRGQAQRPDDHVIVLFGATGDLARRKLLPGLYHLAAAGLMPDRYRVIGSARKQLTDEEFAELARQAITEFGTGKPAGQAWDDLQRKLPPPAPSLDIKKDPTPEPGLS